MACKNIAPICDRLVVSTAINYSALTNTLIISLPDGTYDNEEKYCIVLAQNLPSSTAISANVVVTIGSSITQYPLLNSDCTNVQAYQLSTRTRYSTVVHTNIQSGVFKLLGKACCGCCNNNTAPSLPIT